MVKAGEPPRAGEPPAPRSGKQPAEPGLVFAERGAAAVPADVLHGLLGPHVAAGARAALVSTELTTLHFIEEMARRGLPIEDRLLRGDIHFVPVYGLMGKRAPRREVLPKLRRSGAIHGRSLVAIDAFSRILGSHFRGASPQAAWREAEDSLWFFHTLADEGATVVLTFEPNGIEPRVRELYRRSADRLVDLSAAPPGPGEGALPQ